MQYKTTEHILMRCPNKSLNDFYDFMKLSNYETVNFCQNDRLFLEAIAIASQDLYKMCSNGSCKTTNRMLESVKKYYARMSARPTPYGLFAGVATVQFNAGSTNISLTNQKKYHKICRVDNDWYFRLVKKIEETPELLLNLQVVFNRHCYNFNGRLKNLYCSNLRKENIIHAENLNIKYTRQVQYVQEFASDFVSFKDLRDFLIGKNPDVPKDIIDKFLYELIQNEYLYTNICWLSKQDDPLHSLLYNNRFVNLTEQTQTLLDKLFEIDRLRQSYAKTTLGEGEDILAELSELMGQVVKSQNYIYTILQLDLSNNLLDNKIKNELE